MRFPLVALLALLVSLARGTPRARDRDGFSDRFAGALSPRFVSLAAHNFLSRTKAQNKCKLVVPHIRGGSSDQASIATLYAYYVSTSNKPDPSIGVKVGLVPQREKPFTRINEVAEEYSGRLQACKGGFSAPEHRVVIPFDTWIVITRASDVEKCVHQTMKLAKDEGSPSTNPHFSKSKQKWKGGAKEWVLSEDGDTTCLKVLKVISQCMVLYKSSIVGPPNFRRENTEVLRRSQTTGVGTINAVYAWRFDPDICKKSKPGPWRKKLQATRDAVSRRSIGVKMGITNRFQPSLRIIEVARPFTAVTPNQHYDGANRFTGLDFIQMARGCKGTMTIRGEQFEFNTWALATRAKKVEDCLACEGDSNPAEGTKNSLNARRKATFQNAMGSSCANCAPQEWYKSYTCGLALDLIAKCVESVGAVMWHGKDGILPDIFGDVCSAVSLLDLQKCFKDELKKGSITFESLCAEAECLPEGGNSDFIETSSSLVSQITKRDDNNGASGSAWTPERIKELLIAAFGLFEQIVSGSFDFAAETPNGFAQWTASVDTSVLDFGDPDKGKDGKPYGGVDDLLGVQVSFRFDLAKLLSGTPIAKWPLLKRVALSVYGSVSIPLGDEARHLLRRGARLASTAAEKMQELGRRARKLADFGKPPKGDTAAEAARKVLEQELKVAREGAEKASKEVAEFAGKEIAETGGRKASLRAVLGGTKLAVKGAMKLAAKVAAKVLLKMVPGLNVILLAMDLYDLGTFLYDTFSDEKAREVFTLDSLKKLLNGNIPKGYGGFGGERPSNPSSDDSAAGDDNTEQDGVKARSDVKGLVESIGDFANDATEEDVKALERALNGVELTDSVSAQIKTMFAKLLELPKFSGKARFVVLLEAIKLFKEGKGPDDILDQAVGGGDKVFNKCEYEGKEGKCINQLYYKCSTKTKRNKCNKGTDRLNRNVRCCLSEYKRNDVPPPTTPTSPPGVAFMPCMLGDTHVPGKCINSNFYKCVGRDPTPGLCKDGSDAKSSSISCCQGEKVSPNKPKPVERCDGDKGVCADYRLYWCSGTESSMSAETPWFGDKGSCKGPAETQCCKGTVSPRLNAVVGSNTLSGDSSSQSTKEKEPKAADEPQPRDQQVDQCDGGSYYPELVGCKNSKPERPLCFRDTFVLPDFLKPGQDGKLTLDEEARSEHLHWYTGCGDWAVTDIAANIITVAEMDAQLVKLGYQLTKEDDTRSDSAPLSYAVGKVFTYNYQEKVAVFHGRSLHSRVAKHLDLTCTSAGGVNAKLKSTESFPASDALVKERLPMLKPLRIVDEHPTPDSDKKFVVRVVLQVQNQGLASVDNGELKVTKVGEKLEIKVQAQCK